MPLQFVTSTRGKKHLVYQGYRYSLFKTGTSENTWCCVEKRNNKCRGYAYTSNNEIVRIKEEHNHTPDAAKVEIKTIREKMKTAAKKTSDAPQLIVASCTHGISAGAAGQLPPPRSMKRTICKVRVKSNNYVPMPTSLLTLEIPDRYKMTVGDESFLLFDSGSSSDRIIIFGTMKNIQLMQDSPNWFSDGTFKAAPPLFEQLYTIHTSRHNKVIPAVFALLPNKTESTYVKMLRALKDLAPNLEPSSIMTDFEKAAKNAFRKVFPGAVQNGCLFHFGQCFWRRIQQHREVSKKYVEDPDYALKVKCLTALAFVPACDVREAFQVLISDDFYSSSREIEALVDYVEETWVGGNNRGRAKKPCFRIEEWNCYQRVLDDLARTNNGVEGWNRAFQSLLGASHPSIWAFIDKLKIHQSANELEIQQSIAGQVPQPQRPKYRDITDRLKIIVEGYEKKTVSEYLRGIAHNLSLNV